MNKFPEYYSLFLRKPSKAIAGNLLHLSVIGRLFSKILDEI